MICSAGELLVIDDKTGQRVLELRHQGWTEAGKAVQVQYTGNGKTFVFLFASETGTINVRDADTANSVFRFEFERGRLEFSQFFGFGR